VYLLKRLNGTFPSPILVLVEEFYEHDEVNKLIKAVIHHRVLVKCFLYWDITLLEFGYDFLINPSFFKETNYFDRREYIRIQ
jgi:hypothetical protein